MGDFLKKVLAILLALGFCFTSIPAGQIAAEPLEMTDIPVEQTIPTEIINEETAVEPEAVPVDLPAATDDGSGYDTATDPQGAVDDGSGYDAATGEYYDTSAPVEDTSADVTEAYQAPVAEPDVYTETPEYVSPSETQSMTEITPAAEISPTEAPNEEVTITQEVTTPEETTPATKTSFIYEDPEIYVEATLDEEDALPENAVFVVKQIFEDSLLDTDRNLFLWSNELLDKYLEKIDLAQVNTFVYDMYFELDGQRLMPAKEFKIKLTYKEDKILDEEAKKENVRIFHLDDNDYTTEIEAFDTNAELWVNENGSVTTAEFKILRYRYTPFMISMIETKEEHEERLAKEAAAAEENNTEDGEKIIYMDDQAQEGEPSSDESEDMIKDDEDGSDTTEEEAEEEPAPERKYYTSWGNDVDITVILSNPAQVPDTAEVVVTAVTPDNTQYNYDAYIEALNSSDESIDYTPENTLLYDIKFVDTILDENGEIVEEVEYEPTEGSVQVILQFKNNQLSNEIKAEDSQNVTVNHLVTDIEADTADISSGDISVLGVDAAVQLEGTDTVTFNTESFSVYAFSYTVDFHWDANGKMYDFTIPGGGFVSFYNLVEALGIEINDTNTEVDEIQELVDNVENIEFSDPELVSVSKVEEDTTVGAIKERLGLECEYSAELTEEQIAEINAQEAKAGDWALISVHPFTSEESLTVTMKNGDQWMVKVTDASGGASTITGTLMRYRDAFPDGKYIIFTQSGDYYYALTNNGERVQINYNPSTEKVTYSGNEPILWESEYVGRSDWPNHYKLNAVDNSQYYLNPGADAYNNLFRQWYGRVYMERRSSNNNAAFTMKGEEGGSKYLGWSNSTFAATDNVTNSIYLASVNDISTKYTFTVTVDDPLHGTVSGTKDDGTSTGEVTDFTLTTENVNSEGYGNYDAASRPITASASNGYSFSHWEVDNSRYTDVRVLNGTLSMASDNVVLKAVFKQNTTVTDEMTQQQIEAQLTAWAGNMLTDSFETNKTAKVYDYGNRIYEIELSASSGIRRVLPMVDLTFITDVSRSMYFPATLQQVATFTQGTNHETNPGNHQTATGEWVSADSSLYDWLNRYGDKNTVYYTIADNSSATVMAIYYDLNYNNPADTERTGVWRYYDSSNVNPPDAQNHYGNPVNKTGKNEPWGNNLTGRLYTQVGTLNRMDYLKMAVETASSVVFGADPYARLGLVTFAASANEGHFYGNDSDFTNALEAVVLVGGTNQADGLDKGRDLFSNNERTDPTPKRVAILITDGAPNQTGVNWTTIGQSAAELKNLYGTDSIELYTLGLSMSMVGTDNQNGLKGIATGGLGGGHWAMAERGSDIVESLKTIIGNIVNEASLKGNITDEIDEAFYPVSSDGTPLSAGDWIGMDGNEIDAIPVDGKYGVITFDGRNFGVQWNNQVVGYNANGEPTWEGKVFVKAKEDFLGGNSINTNKGSNDKFVPTKYIIDNTEYDLRAGDEEKFTKTFATPYVNVDELSMTQNSTEWTVYLGTSVSPGNQIEALLDNVNIREVVSSSVNHMITNKDAMLGSSATDASETFPLKEVLGPDGLTPAQWNTLKDQGYLNIDYSAYGHDHVGTLTLILNKVGDTAEYNTHQTTVTGESVEQYFLTARYVPAGKKDVDYRTTPGGSPGALTDNMSSNNSHVINVYEVPLDVYKTDEKTNPLAGATFKLYRVDNNGSAVPGLSSAHTYVEVASATSGDDGVAQLKANGQPFGLVRGETYYLIETEAPANYTKVNTVWAVEVQTEIGKFTKLNGESIYITSHPVADEGITDDMYPFNWDQGARIVLDGNQSVAVIAKGETEDSTTTINDGSFVSHKKAIAFRHTVKNLLGGSIEINVKKKWADNNDSNRPSSVTFELYRVSEKDHEWGNGIVVPSTCTQEGNKEYTCSVCKKKKTEAINETGHTPGESHQENYYAPTCVEEGGFDMVIRCTVCNAIISSEHTVLAKTEHSWVNQEVQSTDSTMCYDTVEVCSKCNTVNENSRINHDHVWGEWQETTAPQPGVPGAETRVCQRNQNHIETRPIDALPNTTTVTYRTYMDWNGHGWRLETNTIELPIGTTVTIEWTSNTDYNAQIYVNGTADYHPELDSNYNGNPIYVLSGNYYSVNRTGSNPYYFSYNVTVTENMTLDIKTSAWNAKPSSIVFNPSRSMRLSPKSIRNTLAAPGFALTQGSFVQRDALLRGKTTELDPVMAYLNTIPDTATCKDGENHLYKEMVETYTISGTGDEDTWTLKIPNLPQYNEYGKPYTYYVVETPIEGYDTTYSEQGTTNPEIINTPKVTSLTVTKRWAFAESSTIEQVEGKAWPKDVTVHVVVYSKTGDNEPAPTNYKVELTADQPTYTFTGLPEYSGNDKIEYSVVEAGVTGLDSTHFNTVIEGNAENGYTIRNTEKEAVLTIVKTFAGDTLTDAQKNIITFTVTGSGLKDQNGNSVGSLTKTYAEFTDGQWVLNASDGIVEGGTYTVTESNADIGNYTRVTSVVVNNGNSSTAETGEITINGYQGTVAITNTYTKLLDLNILKVDSNGMTTPLAGAKFELRKVASDSTEYLDAAPTYPTTTGEEHKTGSDGEAKFENLAPGYYEIKEVETPAGYVQTGDGVFYIKVEKGVISHVNRTVTTNGEGSHVTWTAGSDDAKFIFTAASGNTPATATVGNDAGVALPLTGGPGTKLFYLIGILLIGLAGAGLVMKRRRKE